MKRTLTCILTITTLLTLLFTSCNADASAGLFKQLADAKKPVEIRYRQIIGKDGTDLYFLTNDGIYKTDGNTTTTVRKNEKGHPVHEAYLDTANDLIIYLINEKSSAEVYRFNLSDTSDTKLSVTSTAMSSLNVKHVLPNGKILVQNKNIDTDAFATIAYDPSTDTFTDDEVFSNLEGYELDSLLFMSGNQQDSPDFMISFVNGEKKYKHYYKAQANEVSLASSLAGFWTNGTNLYLITKDGNLYGSVVPAGPGSTAPTPMKDLSRQFPSNAFVYGMSSGGTTYLITKTTTANEALFVVSFADDTIPTPVNTKVVSTGYASQMSNVNIVSAFDKTTVPATPNLLIATEKNGMFEITITNAATGAGTSVGPENYSLVD